MKTWLACLIAMVGLVLWLGRARADEGSEGSAGSAEEHHEGSAEDHHEGSDVAAAEHHDGEEHHDEAAGAPNEQESPAEEAATEDELFTSDEDGEEMEESGVDPDELEVEEGDPPFNELDEDGDGQVSAEEIADKKEMVQDFTVDGKLIEPLCPEGEHPDAKHPCQDTDSVDAELDKRLKSGKAMLPSISVEQFRKGVRIVKKIVMARMEKQAERSHQKKMAKFTWGVFGFSCLGLLLLGMPLVLAKKYPGQGGVLFKYSALAAVTFFVTVNLFGGVLLIMRGVQGELGKQTDPKLAIIAATFDTLDDNADKYAVMGKELFMPTIEALRGNTTEQPAALLIGNGVKIVKDARVFVTTAKSFKKMMFVLDYLPMILLGVTMLLFVLALKPTLVEIIKLPAMAASGQAGVGRDVVAKSMRRVKGEFLATLCTIGVLAALTLLSGFVLGRVIGPAIDTLIQYFSTCITYLQFAPDASSGKVFLTLFGVIFFLVINLGVLIVSMSFFLGKCQKIFQAKFNAGMPVSAHKPFFKWAIPSVLLVQLFPLVFVWVADKVLASIRDGAIEAAKTDPAAAGWGKALLSGPLFLVAGFLILFWAARGVNAIKFLFKYKVKIPAA